MKENIFTNRLLRLRKTDRLKEYRGRFVIERLSMQIKSHNPHKIPQVLKVVVSGGIGRFKSERSSIDKAIKTMTLITMQNPKVLRSTKAIANFKVRKGDMIGLKVTVRGRKMFEFLDRFINLALPRQRDFQGVPVDSFDVKGNINIGIKDCLVFPETVHSDFNLGVNVCWVINSSIKDLSKDMISLCGVPTVKN